MTRLEIENCYSWLLTDNQVLKETLWKALRFRERNYFHSRLYKQRLWDGYTEFFRLKDGRFLTGLLPEVETALEYLNEACEIVDARNKVNFCYEQIDEGFLNNWLPKGMAPINLYDYQVDLVNQAIKYSRGVIQAPTSAGKAQPLDSVVYTPYGPKPMGSIKMGDEVCTPKGKVARVIGVYPQGEKDVFRITFSNRDEVECCKEHLWLVDGISSGWENKVFSTEHIAQKLTTPKGRKKYAVKPVKKIKFKNRSLKMDPYLLGILLGDGRFGKNHIGLSTKDSEILVACEKLIGMEYSFKPDGCLPKDYRLTKKKRGKKINIFINILRKYELTGRKSDGKFIPIDYKYNNYKKRLSIIQGLMDSDGYVDKKGSLEFCSTSKQLALDFKEIAESLGCICYMRSAIKKYTYKNKIKIGKKAFVISIVNVNGLPICRLSRKLNRFKTPTKRHHRRVINKIEFVGKKPCQCILLDSQDHLYVTNNCIPTHNTNIMLAVLKALPPDTPTLILANRKGLVEQNYEAMTQWGFSNVGRLYDKHVEPNIFTCATVQSLHKIAKVLPKIKALVVDEIHDMMSKTPKQVYNKLKSCSVRVAVSATPFKFGGEDKTQKYNTKGYFGPILRAASAGGDGVLTTKKLQEREILSASNCIFFPINEPELKWEIYQDAVTYGIAENYSFHKIVTKLAKQQKGRTLILVERLAHGDALQSMIPNALWVQGKDNLETRKEVIEKLKHSQEDTIAIATHGIFNTGINVFVHNLINAAGGQADHQIVQRLGRGLRTAEDKDICNYYDFVFNINDYLLEHSKKRIKILKKEGHTVEVKEKIDF